MVKRIMEEREYGKGKRAYGKIKGEGITRKDELVILYPPFTFLAPFLAFPYPSLSSLITFLSLPPFLLLVSLYLPILLPTSSLTNLTETWSGSRVLRPSG